VGVLIGVEVLTMVGSGIVGGGMVGREVGWLRLSKVMAWAVMVATRSGVGCEAHAEKMIEIVTMQRTRILLSFE
jgi:hypothetical protein